MPGDITIRELSAKYLDALKIAGYRESTIWTNYMPYLGSIARYYDAIGQIYYDPATTAAFLQLQQERYERGEIALPDHNLMSAAHRMNEVYMTGTISIYPVSHGTRYILNAEHGRLLDLFLNWKQYGPNTRDDAVWAVKKYLWFFERQGKQSIFEASVDDAKAYLFQVASEVRLSSLHTILLYLRYFHIFLKEMNYPAPDCIELFSYKVYREMPVQSYVTDDELSRILNVVDAETEAGKRDKAMILLAATTGMRACDIIRLQLSDIDWRNGRIRIVQNKTRQAVSLPLLPEAGKPLQDYILNGRPESACPEVFLRLRAPRVAITDAASIGDMFKSYQKKAGIVRQPFDGKGFHGLRRRLAKKLIVNGTPLTTVAQILGHNDLESSRQYLSLDTGNLKECALDFSGIPNERRELR